jgi:hypothetical protein
MSLTLARRYFTLLVNGTAVGLFLPLKRSNTGSTEKKYCHLSLGQRIGIKEEIQVSGTMLLIMENSKPDTLAFKTTAVTYFLEI